MKIQKATVAAVILMSIHSWGVLVGAEKGDHKDGSTSKTGGGRDAVDAPAIPKLPSRYAELIEALGTKEGNKSTVVSCGTGNLTEDEKADKLLHHLESLKNYRSQMDKCDDDAHKKFRAFVDSYIEKFHVEAATKDSLDDISKKHKKITGLEAALLYHEPIKAFIAKKASELEKQKDKFAKADTALLEAITGISEICTIKKDKDGKPEYSTDTQVKKEIVAFEKHQKDTKLVEANACELDKKIEIAEEEESATAPGEGAQADGKPEHSPAPPTGNGNTPAVDAGGAGGTPIGQPVNPQLPPVSIQGTPITGTPGIDNGLNGGPSDFEQQLLNELVRARQDATRPNEIGGSPQRDNSRSFQFPPVSVSPQPQQQQYPQQQPYPQQQMPPFPYGAMMQPPAAQPIPAELLAPRQPAQNPNAAANAAQTQALVDMAKMQQQLMQAQMQNQMMMNQNAGTSNINNVRNRAAFRGVRGGASSRFMSRGRSMSRSTGYRAPGVPVAR